MPCTACMHCQASICSLRIFHSCMHSSVVHAPVPSLTLLGHSPCPLTYLLHHSVTHSLILSFTHSPHAPTHPLIHPVDRSFISSFNPSIDSFTPSFTHASVQPVIHTPMHSALIHPFVLHSSSSLCVCCFPDCFACPSYHSRMHVSISKFR